MKNPGEVVKHLVHSFASGNSKGDDMRYVYIPGNFREKSDLFGMVKS